MYQLERVLRFRYGRHHTVDSLKRLLETALGLIATEPDSNLGTSPIYLAHHCHLMRLLLNVALIDANYDKERGISVVLLEQIRQPTDLHLPIRSSHHFLPANDAALVQGSLWHRIVRPQPRLAE
jgi:hypothetical protein